MTPTAIIFMIIGLGITWGGMLYSISVQIKMSKQGDTPHEKGAM